VTPNLLHVELAGRIAQAIQDQGIKAGTRLNEKRLADLLHVSRTPVRAALDYLESQGFVKRVVNLGVELLKTPPVPAAPVDKGPQVDETVFAIAHDRHQGHLAEYVSESDLMARYGLARPALKEALERLADLGVIERTPGYGWRFLADVWGAAARQEAYRFRMVIEPEAMRQPGYALPPGWAKEMRRRHQSFVKAPWTDTSSIEFFEMNAAFHEGLAAASGNRYFASAIERLNRLRRLSNYDWILGSDRVQGSCNEHLAILSRLEAGDTELAAILMRRHLDTSRQLPSSAQVRD